MYQKRIYPAQKFGGFESPSPNWPALLLFLFALVFKQARCLGSLIWIRAHGHWQGLNLPFTQDARRMRRFFFCLLKNMGIKSLLLEAQLKNVFFF